MIGCRECGSDMTGIKQPALHCSQPCRLAFNRRRRDRGAELYDFIMAGDQEKVTELISAYRQADKVKRQGRPSYQPTQQAQLRLPMMYGMNGDNR